MADNSFVAKLRMNNIFPSGDRNPSPLIGMPDFFSGRQLQPQQPTGMQNVAQRIQNPKLDSIVPRPGAQSGPELNYEYKPPESDKYGTQILMGTTPRDQQARALQLAQVKGAPAAQNANINQQKVDLAKFKAQNPNMRFMISKGGNIQAFNPLTGEAFDTGVDSGTLSEEEKIQLTGEQARQTENTRQTGRMELQGVKGEQNLKAIGERIKGNKEVADTRVNTPTQDKAAQATAIQQIQTTRPDLAQYLKKDPTTGQITIDPNTPLNELAMIQNIINPKTKQKDIELPSSSNKTPTSQTPTSKTPTAAELIKKYGG